MPKKNSNILKYNQGGKSLRMWINIYTDRKTKKTKISSTTKMTKHVSCGYSFFTHCSFDGNKNKQRFYRSDGCMYKFCADLKNHTTKMTHCDEKEVIPLTKKQDKKYKNQKHHIYKEEFDDYEKHLSWRSLTKEHLMSLFITYVISI